MAEDKGASPAATGPLASGAATASPAEPSVPSADDEHVFYRCLIHGWACYGHPCPRCQQKLGGIPSAETSAHEYRLKYLGEMTIQRRIHEHAREKAKRELDHAQGELSRLDAEAMRLVNEWRSEWSAAPKGDAQP